MDVSVLLGEVLVSVEDLFQYSDQVVFRTQSGRSFRMFHDQECCESVGVEEVIGDVQDLIGSQLVEAEASSSQDNSGNYDSATWTFYRFRTANGSVVIRWLGESNGWYSEEVSFEEIV